MRTLDTTNASQLILWPPTPTFFDFQLFDTLISLNFFINLKKLNEPGMNTKLANNTIDEYAT